MSNKIANQSIETGRSSTQTRPNRSRKTRVGAAAAAATIAAAAAACSSVGAPAAQNRQGTVNLLCNIFNLGRGPCNPNTGVVAKVNADGTILYDMCAPGDPQLDKGRLPVDYIKRYTLAQMIEASGAQRVCRMTLGSTGDLNAPQVFKMCAENGVTDPKNCAGAIIELTNPDTAGNGSQWEYAGMLQPGKLKPADVSAEPATTSAPNKNSSGNSGGGSNPALAAAKSFIGVETYDATGHTNVSLCIDGSPITSTAAAAGAAQSQLEQTITPRGCEADLSNMGSNTAPYDAITGHLGAVIIGSTAADGTVLSAALAGMQNPNIH